jgi:hypothetical protein
MIGRYKVKNGGIYWLIIYCFTSHSRIVFYLYGYVTINGEGLQKFRPMISAKGLRAGMGFYRAKPAATRGLGSSSLIWRTTPCSHLLGRRIYSNPILKFIPERPMILADKMPSSWRRSNHKLIISPFNVYTGVYNNRVYVSLTSIQEWTIIMFMSL